MLTIQSPLCARTGESSNNELEADLLFTPGSSTTIIYKKRSFQLENKLL